MEIGFIGGIVRRSDDWSAYEANWSWCDGDIESFLSARGDDCRLFAEDDIAVLIRGHVVDTHSRRPRDVAGIAARIRQAYRDNSTLPIDGLEGSFTIGLFDGPNQRLLLFRNVMGSGDVFYHSGPTGVFVGSNLATVVESSGTTPRVNEADLATLFIYRTITGPNTLFAGFHRLLPGEQLDIRNGRVTCTLRQTLGDLQNEQLIGREALDRLEETMTQICADQAAEAPDAANLLSGGVDSSFLQVFWNRTAPGSQPRTYCVGVDHPRTRSDLEYALSAAAALKTDHQVIPGNDPYAGYLWETIAASGELPNHAQFCYFLGLARGMQEQGTTAALTAISADNLFGLSGANKIQNAAVLRRLCPTSWLRRGGAAIARLFRMSRLRDYFHLADRLYDLSYSEHPGNQVSCFTHWPTVKACFGASVQAGLATDRQKLLDRYGVSDRLLDRLHATSLLTSGITTGAFMTTILNYGGVRLFAPFVDSRLLKLVFNLSPRERFRFRQPKSLLKRSLDRNGHGILAHRQKLGWGQPIFEWLSPGGQLRPLVEEMDDHDFVDPTALAEAKARPNWFLYTLLCFDLWHKMFVSRTMSRGSAKPQIASRVA